MRRAVDALPHVALSAGALTPWDHKPSRGMDPASAGGVCRTVVRSTPRVHGCRHSVNSSLSANGSAGFERNCRASPRTCRAVHAHAWPGASGSSTAGNARSANVSVTECARSPLERYRLRTRWPPRSGRPMLERAACAARRRQLPRGPMQTPLRIRYRGLTRSLAIDTCVREHAAQLEPFQDRIRACEVSVERWHQHHRHGHTHRVAIALTIAGADLAVSAEPQLDGGADALAAAVRDAFRIAAEEVESALRHPNGKRPTADAERADGRRAHGLHGLV